MKEKHLKSLSINYERLQCSIVKQKVPIVIYQLTDQQSFLENLLFVLNTLFKYAIPR